MSIESVMPSSHLILCHPLLLRPSIERWLIIYLLNEWISEWVNQHSLPDKIVTYCLCKESRVPKKWCLRTVVLEKTSESSLDSKEMSKKMKPVNLKGNQPWILFGRTDVEAETPIVWPPDAKNWLFWKDPDAGKDWSQEEKGTTEDEMVGWHHQLNGHEFE